VYRTAVFLTAVNKFLRPRLVITIVCACVWLQGLALRSRPRIWNNGDGQLKFILLRQITAGSLQAAPQTDITTTAQLAAMTARR
jgi:hypothetical protein